MCQYFKELSIFIPAYRDTISNPAGIKESRY